MKQGYSKQQDVTQSPQSRYNPAAGGESPSGKNSSQKLAQQQLKNNMGGPTTRTNPKLQNNGGANQASRQHRLTKSYNLDSISQRITNKDKQQRQMLLDGEQRASNGNIIALACGPLRKKRYINPKIELELVDFKKEIEEKFEKSPLRAFVMPRRSEQSNH